ncbi:TetR/AcrR family transcriptional regulator [Marinactinospora thermotolerans]|uniref:Transcriptional regulator, TetR family n=1 Tax=Marinactinospora thermotolerans DSM 45154 TaxID=1122192 RepID=A0A1T4KA41_9ACTN|nr:TetR/AcrR family transcriptional regulator [Marinactinospora thermotolerans]SJZ39310.1 transcriptional regulator, TetR family [Marinactinospora thermotolerans DSM 45154]
MSRNNAGLSAGRIITEALKIIDGRGLSGLTMRRLGDALQVEAMAIYHHFPLGKDQLYAAIVEHITDTTRPVDGDAPAAGAAEEEAAPRDEEPGDDRPWQERLRSWAEEYRARLLRHSGALPLIVHRKPDSASALRSLEAHYAAFEEAGLDRDAIARAAAALDAYVTGAVIHQVRAEGRPGPAPASLDARHPHLAELGDPAPDYDAWFLDGLEALLAGLRLRFG